MFIFCRHGGGSLPRQLDDSARFFIWKLWRSAPCNVCKVEAGPLRTGKGATKRAEACCSKTVTPVSCSAPAAEIHRGECAKAVTSAKAGRRWTVFVILVDCDCARNPEHRT